MKAIKLLSVAFAMAFAMNANAQFVNAGGSSSSGESQDYQYYEGYGKDKCMTNELSVYLGEAWGLGWQLRRELNKYVALNIVGISYMAGGWVSPDEAGSVNFRFLGARGYSPSWKWIRGYVDLNMGYTLGYVGSGSNLSSSDKKIMKSYGIDVPDDDVSHHFGLDFGVGLQLHKRLAIGYHMGYVTGYGGMGGGTSHFCQLSVLF
jgi:hypothetical protein